jgi:hypothetical protein
VPPPLTILGAFSGTVGMGARAEQTGGAIWRDSPGAQAQILWPTAPEAGVGHHVRSAPAAR